MRAFNPCGRDGRGPRILGCTAARRYLSRTKESAMSLTPAQQRIVAMADDLAARFAERAPRHDADSSFPHENWRDLHDAGYLRLVIPRQYGGDGASVLD